MRTSFRSLVFFGLAVICSTIQAGAQPVSFGVELTTSYSSLVYDEPMEIWDPTGSLSFGIKAYGTVPIAGLFRLRPGIRVARIQSRVPYQSTTPTLQIPDGEFRTKQDYVSIPILLDYTLGNGPFFLTIGPEPGYLLASSMDIPESAGPMPDADDLRHRMKRVNLAVVGGAGAEFMIQTHRLHVYVRLSRGLTGVAKDTKTVLWYSDWVTQEIGFAVGYTL